MKLYHFSDKYFDPDEYIPIGNFKKTIAQGRKIVTEFEDYLEQRRSIIDPSKISRLNCLFTFPGNVADGFKTKRKFMYELELTDDVKFQTHNHEIISYFEKLFALNDINYIKDEQNLVDSYWLNNHPFQDSNGIKINVGEEILVNKPLKVNRTILVNDISYSEFIELNLPLYHITPTKNIENILKNGLQNRNGKGICFVQKKHQLIIKYIVETMLINESDKDFSVIEIKPKTINLKHQELDNDQVYEKTNCIHNYIKRDVIEITEKNIVKTYRTLPLGIPDLKELEDEMDRKGLFMPLNKNNG